MQTTSSSVNTQHQPVSDEGALRPLPKPPGYAQNFPGQEGRWREKPTGPMTRPAGDHRSAERIIRVNSTLSSFLNGPPSSETLEHLKKQVGDWTPDNPDFDSRADAAFSLAKVTNYVDDLNDRRVGNSDQNGLTDGFTYDAELRHGVAQYRSEASLIEEFGERGYPVFENLGN